MEEINDESKNLFTSATGVGESRARSIIESSDQTDVKQAKRRSEQSCESSSEKRKSESEVTETIGVQETTNVSSTAQQQKQKHGKIARGFSMVDPEMVSKLHSDIKMKGKDGNEESYGYFQDVVHFSFTLPDFSQYDKEFVEFLMKDLIENSTLKALEGSGK